jgi:8-oxo-dGTP pyrophosphatase MutT (NUDIX family)
LADRSDPGLEAVEWVAEDGSVIEVVTRRRMRAERLLHRVTYVAVVVDRPERFARPSAADRLDPATEVVVHRRAEWKDVCPGYWDLAFGGVCGVGEDWPTSARRELAEEAGIELDARHPLIDLGPADYRDPTGGGSLGRAFLAAWPDEPVSVDGEAVAFARVALADLEVWLASVSVCPDSAALVAPALLDRVVAQA